MLSTAAAWKHAQSPFEIEFEPGRLDEIRAAVVDGLYAIPRGGLEIGGLLLGTREKGKIRITGFQTIVCEHLTGPSFHLSAKDKDGLRVQMAGISETILGFFVSHTRSGILLSARDQELYSEFFPEPWQIAMVLRPVHMEPVRAGYFFRDAAGLVKTERSLDEFVVEPMPEQKPKLPVPAEAVLAGAALAASITQTPETPIEGATDPLPPKKKGPHWLLWVNILFLLVALVGVGVLVMEARKPRAPEPLHLQATEVESKLVFRWEPVRDGSSGTLTIVEAGQEQAIPLDANAISRGMYVYDRKAAKTVARLKTGNREDSATFEGPLAPPKPAPADLEKAQADEEKAKRDLADETLKNQQLQRKLRQLNQKLEQQPQ